MPTIKLDLTQPKMPSQATIDAVKAAFAAERRSGEDRRSVDRGSDRRSVTSIHADELGLATMSRAELVAAVR